MATLISRILSTVALAGLVLVAVSPLLQVRGGPSNVDNEMIRSCAKAARDTIGPAQIRVDAPEPAAAGSGSGSG